jgi:hypothetical protein
VTVASGHPDWLPPGAVQWGTLLSGTANLTATAPPQNVFVVDASAFTVADVRLSSGTATLQGTLTVEWRDTDGTVIATENVGVWQLGGITRPTGVQVVVRGPRLALVFTWDGTPGTAGTVKWNVGLRNGPFTGPRTRPPELLAIWSPTLAGGATNTISVGPLEPGTVEVVADVESGTGSTVSVWLESLSGAYTNRHRLPNLGSGPLQWRSFWRGGQLILNLRNNGTASINVNVTLREL